MATQRLIPASRLSLSMPIGDGRLEAVDSLPQIEALLKSLIDKPAEKTLEIEVTQVIEHLRAIKMKKKDK